MASHGYYAALEKNSSTLAPLPSPYRTGLIAVGTVALISFISTTTLFIFLSYKLLTSMIKSRRRRRPSGQQVIHDEPVFGPPYQYKPFQGNLPQRIVPDFKPDPRATKMSHEEVRNPFPLLTYNLLLAEMQASLGYALNIEWVVRDGIWVGTKTCWAQGWLNNIGVLASSIFLLSISLNTYLSVVRGFLPPQWFIRVWITLCWLLALILTSAGIIQSSNGRSEGGWFVRANTWCWVNSKYASARLWGEYAWIMTSIPVTIILYTLVFWTLYRDKRCCRCLPRRRDSFRENNVPSGQHPAFLVYPFIYIACTSPLAIARLITIGGGTPSTTYYCISGLLLASNGFWNTILWLTTVFFTTPEDLRNTGLDQFAFIRTPTSRRYGNMVWINGPASKGNNAALSRDAGWWWWKMGGQTRWQGNHSRNISQQSLKRDMNAPVQDNCIHLDVITMVVVEESIGTMTDAIHSASTSTSERKMDEHMPGILGERT